MRRKTFCTCDTTGVMAPFRQMEIDFEGTLILEKLAEIGKVDAFFDAIDSDDVGKAVSLMKRAQVDAETIAIVVKKMKEL